MKNKNEIVATLLAEQKKHYNAWQLKKSLAALRRDYYEPADELQQQADFHYGEYIKIRGQIEQLTKNENNQSTLT